MLEVIVAIAVIITGIATFVLAVTTWRYVRLTKDILEENRQMRIDAQTPKIAINPCCFFVREPNRTLICLCIENVGPGSAYDVQFKTYPNFKMSAWHSLEDVHIIRKGINYLKPGGQKNCEITRNEFERQKEILLNITVSYKDSRNKEYREHFCIDFNETRGVLDAVPEN